MTAKSIMCQLVFAFLLISVSAYSQQTIKICALRVEFTPDQNELTTGDGTFMVDTVTTDEFAIDPAPHNREYFNDQIKAAANYFDNVSDGRIIIEGDVFPRSMNGAYRLSNPMAFYNPNTTDEEINRAISQLFVDAIELADNEDQTLDFSGYDLVVIFHAGVGKDIDTGFDETPQDIPSLFITHDFLKKSFGNDFQGVPVNDGGPITQGILLPETENQDGYMIALTGFFVSNIGSYLELYDLFSPSTQRSGVGRFDLMDVGLLNMNGLVPAKPGAFTRKILGWDEPVVINKPQNNIELARLGCENQQNKPFVIQIPINNDEYFLLEYRGDSNVDLDSLYYELSSDRDEMPSYLELLKTYCNDQIEVSDSSGVLLSITDYDWGLPGAGILIWHIDESVIAANGPENKINDDPKHRAVDIEEADGSEDIGQSYYFLEGGYGSELGTWVDFWFKDNKAYLYKNEFSNSSIPNTKANLNNAVSHITINNFSGNNSDIMTFNYLRGFYEEGYPLSLTADTANTAYSIAGLVESETSEFFFSCDSGNIYAAGAGGGGLFFENKFMIAKNNSSTAIISLALADTSGNQKNEFLFAAAKDSLYGFSLDKSNVGGDSLTQKLFSTGFNASIISPVVIKNDSIYLACNNDSIYALDFSGNIINSLSTVHGVADIAINTGSRLPDFTGAVDYAALAALNESAVDLITYNELTKTFSVSNPAGVDEFEVSASPNGQFAVVDMDNNGVYDIVFNADHGIYAYNLKGFLISGFPIKPKLLENENLVGTPLIFDADGDGILDLIASTSAGQVIGYNVNGYSLSDFPLSAGGGIETSPILTQLDQDEGMELMVVTSGGSLYAWQLTLKEDDPQIFWTQSNYNAANNVLIEDKLTYKPVTSSLMPSSRAYNYPNPNSGSYTTIRYYLNEPASVKIRIFDTAGTPVDQFSAPGNGGVDNEITWDVSSVASGVYLCQIEAKSDGGSESKIIKIMVVH